MFLQLIDTHFPPTNKLRKIFNCKPLMSVTAELKIYHKL